MTFNSLGFSQRASGTGGNEVDEIRTLVAKHLDIDIKYVTNDAHLTDDLGVDWPSSPPAGRGFYRRLTMVYEIEIGSGVRLKSGGPAMTVEAIFADHWGTWVRCSWSDDTRRISQTFDLRAVELSRA
jgi:uncharacterized protein YodC (DUF2158 family)